MPNLKKCGAHDSKYFGRLEQFEIDVEAKINESVSFENELRELVLRDPNKIKQRYNEAIKVFLEIKKEYGI